MTLDTIVNAAYTTLTNSPGTAGTSFECDDGTVFGSTFPMHVVLAPASGRILPGNYEIVKISSRASDTLTVVREQKSTTAIDAASGYRIFGGILAHQLMDIYNSREFLVNGSHFPLTRAGVQAAIDAASALGGGKVVLIGTDLVTDGTAITGASNVHITATPGFTMKLPANSTAYNMFTLTGSTGSDVINLSANTVIGDRSVTVASGGGVYSVGDYVIIRENTSRFLSQVSVVKSATATTITLQDACASAYLTANGSYIAKINDPIENFHVSNIRFDANGNTGESRVFYSTYGLMNSQFNDLYFKDFYRSVIFVDWGYRNRIQNIKIDACGSGAHDTDIGESAIGIYRNSFLTIDSVDTLACGFAVGAFFGSTTTFTNIKDSWANGRSVKMHAMAFSTITNSHVQAGWTAAERGAAGGWTGFIVSGGSHHCRVIGCSSIGNGSYGFAMDYCVSCKFIDCDSSGNINGDFIISNVDGTSSDNSIINCSYTTISDAGTNTVIVDRNRIDFADFNADPTINGQLVRDGNDLKYYNGSSVITLTSTAVESHGASSHTNRTRYKELDPWVNVGTGSVTALTVVMDTHASLPVNSGHIEFADGDDESVLTVAYKVITVPADFASGGKINIWWSTTATSLDAYWKCAVYSPAINSSSKNTIINSGNSSEGAVITTSDSTANEMNKTTFNMGVISSAPVAGRPLFISIWREGADVLDTLSASAQLWHADFEYTADM